MTSISLKVKADQLDQVLKALEQFEVSDVIISDLPAGFPAERHGRQESESFSESKSIVQESYASYKKGEKVFSINQAEKILEKVILA